MGDNSAALALAAAEAAKGRGNSRFAAKEYELAIEAYSEAIALEPEGFPLHVVYSNRSAAYLAKGDAKSRALQDAMKCVALAPSWAKGYGRLGAAQSALGRFADAQASYIKARDLDGANETYERGLEAAKEGEKRATERRIAEEQEAARQEAAREAAANEAKRAEDDGALSEFFAAIGQSEKPKKKVTEKYAKQALGDAASNIARLTESHAEFKNLNPYRVLALDVDATVEDVKARYRKLSALCHPDKNLDKADEARLAFEAVKAAYQSLLDDKTRDRVVLVVQGARERAKLNFDAGRGLSLEEAMDKEVMKTFAQNEMKRRDVEEHQRVHAARERAQADELKKKEEAEQKFEEQWNQDDRRSDRVDFWHQFQGDNDRAGVQKRIRHARNFKTQEKVEKKPKYGQVDLESWKRDWK